MVYRAGLFAAESDKADSGDCSLKILVENPDGMKAVPVHDDQNDWGWNVPHQEVKGFTRSYSMVELEEQMWDRMLGAFNWGDFGDGGVGGNGGSTSSTTFVGSNYYFDSEGNMLAIHRSTEDPTDRFYQLMENETTDETVTFKLIEEIANNEVTSDLAIPGNYWNRLDDYTKVRLILDYANEKYSTSVSDHGPEGILTKTQLNIIQNHTKTIPYREDRVIGWITNSHVKTGPITYGMPINPGGADSKYILPRYSWIPATFGINSTFTIPRQSFRPNFTNANGQFYTDQSGNYIPIRLRPNY